MRRAPVRSVFGAFSLGLLAALAGCGTPGSVTPIVATGPVVVALVGAVDQVGHDAIYGYDAQGHFVRRLSGALGAGWGVNNMLWSPDRTRIAFSDDKESADRQRVYVVEVDGGDPVAITDLPLAPGNAYVSTIAWSPDGTRLLLYADLEADGAMALYVVDALGGTPVPLNDPSKSVYYSTWFWSPAGTHVTWMETDVINGPLRQMVATADGLSVVDASGPMVAGGGVRARQGVTPWAPDGSRVAFAADKEVDDRFDMYTVLPNGTGLVKLSTGLPAGADCWTPAFSPDSSVVAFLEGVSGVTSDLVVVPSAGGAVTTLSDGNEYVNEFLWRPGANDVAWSSSDDVLVAYLLRMRSLGGPPAVTLYTSAGVAEGIAADWSWSPDGGRIAFRAGDEDVIQDHLRLLCVRVDTPGPFVDLIPALTASGNVGDRNYEWFPDGSKVLAQAYIDDVVPEQVFLCHTNGSGTDQVSDVTDAQSGVSGIGVSSDGLTTAWIEGHSAPDETLYIAGPLGDAQSNPFPSGPELWYFRAK